MVDQGPSLRNISSFPVQIRKNKIQIIVPNQIPAFSLRETLAREEVDPRTYVLVGDSEACLSAIITLRFTFMGRIIVVPTSSNGGFENRDVLTRKFGPLNKSEVFMVEPDLFNKACVEVKPDGIRKIDHEKRTVYFEDGDECDFEGLLF